MELSIKRWEGNPILRPIDNHWESMQVRNPGAYYDNGKVYLVYTARAERNTIYLGLAVSEDGFNFERAGEEPFYPPSKDGFDAGTVEDARMVKFGDTFYISYVARSIGKDQFDRGELNPNRPNDNPTWTQNLRRGGLLTTKDFKTVECFGPITNDDVYDCNIVIFPEKVNDQYVMLHRPTEFNPKTHNCVEAEDNKPGINIAFSDDLVNWNDDYTLIKPEQEWESLKIGGSTPPIRTDRGWLTLYHGVCGETREERIYRVGVMLLDLDDPRKVIAKAPNYIFEPEEEWEKKGTVNNVVFPNGNVVIGDDVFIYYGGADTVCAVATVPLEDLLAYVLQYRK